MKSLLPILALSILPAISVAEILTFELNATDSYQSGISGPLLDLTGPTKVIINVGDDSKILPFEKISVIEKLEIIFPNAKNFVAENIELVNGEYIGRANNTWLYNGVDISVRAIDGLVDNGLLELSLDIATSENYLKDEVNQYVPDTHLLDMHGRLEDSRDRVLADTATLDFQGKPLTISAYKNLQVNDYMTSTLDLNINWLGHGNVDFQSSANFPAPESHNQKVFAIDVSDPNGPNPLIIFSLKDSDGNKHIIDKPLDLLLNLAEL